MVIPHFEFCFRPQNTLLICRLLRGARRTLRRGTSFRPRRYDQEIAFHGFACRRCISSCRLHSTVRASIQRLCRSEESSHKKHECYKKSDAKTYTEEPRHLNAYVGAIAATGFGSLVLIEDLSVKALLFVAWEESGLQFGDLPVD